MASRAFPSIKSTTHPFLEVELCYDPHPEQPDLHECTITYNNRSSYLLGTEAVDIGTFETVAKRVNSGEYIGMPVWAYVHGASMIRAAERNPFSCPWDSGQSGWVYMTRDQVREFYGVKRITKSVKERALAHLRASVEEFSQYLNGEVYGFIIRDTRTDEALDACWGYYGEKQLVEDALSALKQMENITPCQLELAL